MSNGPDGTLRAASDGGLSGDHPAEPPFHFLVAPATADEFNTARLRLIPVACWQVDDLRFAFDSSFVDADPAPDSGNSPSDIREELSLLSTLVQDHPGAPLSVFGHADPVGCENGTKGAMKEHQRTTKAGESFGIQPLSPVAGRLVA
jgi:hypothetical protein